MDPELNKLVQQAINGGIASLRWWLVLPTVMTVISAIVVSFFSAYLKRSGENFATLRDFNRFHKQLRIQTQTTEKIKGDIALQTGSAIEELKGEIAKQTGIAMEELKRDIQKMLKEHEISFKVASDVELRLHELSINELSMFRRAYWMLNKSTNLLLRSEERGTDDDIEKACKEVVDAIIGFNEMLERVPPRHSREFKNLLTLMDFELKWGQHSEGVLIDGKLTTVREWAKMLRESWNNIKGPYEKVTDSWSNDIWETFEHLRGRLLLQNSPQEKTT